MNLVELWVRFFTASIASGDRPSAAAKNADKALEEFLTRFNQTQTGRWKRIGEY